jgi:glycosyltransferase involved in cell wall biosynthesis
MYFFDPRAELNISSVATAVPWGFRSLVPPSVSELPLSGRVVSDDFRHRLPSYSRLLNSRNLFVLAHNHFNVWGQPLRIRVPRPPRIMHWTYPLPIEVVGAKNIYTLHDLVPLRLPHTTTDHKRRYLKLMQAIAKRADHIVTVSEASQKDIVDILNVAPERVTNTYQAVDFPASVTSMSKAQAQAEVRGFLGLPFNSYFLFFGAIEPKKNVGRLIEAFLAADVKSPLIIVGKKAWKSEQELRLLGLGAERLGSTKAQSESESRRIIHVDYVPLSLLVSLIRGAKAVVFPSLYEGFGLPVLEAMTLGTPVITSTAASLPEVAGDAALLVDPYERQSITQAIRRLDSDPALCAALAARGLVQAALFSPEIYRGRLKALYRRLGVEL